MSNYRRIVERAGMDRGRKRRMWADLRRKNEQLWIKQHMGALASLAADEARRKT